MNNGYLKANGAELGAVGSQGFVKTITDNTTLTSADSGARIMIATDAKVISLGSDTKVGDEFVIINSGANGNNIVTISPASTDKIVGLTHRRQGTTADATTAGGLVCISGGVANKDFVNTKATAIQYDFVHLQKIDSTTWLILNGLGIWASEG